MSDNYFASYKSNYHDVDYQNQLLTNGSRQQIIDWLVWNDKNGIYTDRDSEAEDKPHLTLDTARLAMRRILNKKSIKKTSKKDYKE